jgi:hypothetical protein
MIQTINFTNFCDGFSSDKFSSCYTNQFSYKGKKALFDYLEELEESTGDKIEFDPIALCCEYTEYDDLADCLANYDNIKTLEELENNTQVIKLEDSDGIIIMNF